MSDVSARIKRNIDTLTESQRRLAEYVVSNREMAAFLSTAELGKATGTSQSTVVRFARNLGYAGYPEFQASLQSDLRNQLTTVDRLMGSLRDNHGGEHLVDAVMGADIRSLQMTRRQLDRETFQAVIDSLWSANRIHIIGARGAFGLAHVLGFGLNWVLRNASVPMVGPGEALDNMMLVGPGDLVFALSFPRYTRSTVELLRLAKQRGTTTVALTDSVMSPLTPHADMLLTAQSQQVSYADSLCAPLSVINAILAAVGARDRELTASALEEMEDLWRSHGTYTGESRV